MSTTLRYFPALKEEFVHINAAMKLQNISWDPVLECTVVPLIVSAVNTSDEIAAAAVARGTIIQVRASEITLHMGISDWLIMILVTFGIFVVVYRRIKKMVKFENVTEQCKEKFCQI